MPSRQGVKSRAAVTKTSPSAPPSSDGKPSEQLSSRKLPSKEASLFKSVLKHYEHKQYRKGLKMADQILKRFPAHGETLAMKGLFYSHLERKPEAYQMVKLGLRADLKSHICWHVYGLLHRSDKNYEEAMKCYTHALKFDKDNLQILRDFSLLQIQMRSYEGFNDTRLHLLELKPHNRAYWVGLAISHHLLRNYDEALHVLDAYEQSLEMKPEKDIEFSELLLYKNMVIEESGNTEMALKHLLEVESRVTDELYVLEKKAAFLTKLGHLDKAKVAFRKLIKINPDNRQYVLGFLVACVPFGSQEEASLLDRIDPKKKQKAADILGSLRKRFTRSGSIDRMQLDYAEGDQFEQLLEEYIRKRLKKGVPSLHVSLKSFYDSDPEALRDKYTTHRRIPLARMNEPKVRAMEKIALKLYQNLKNSGSFDGDLSDVKEPPTALLWCTHFLSQHFDQMMQHQKALEYVNEAQKHSPTLVELYMMQARILKHMGDLQRAEEAMDAGRELDLQDRYINTKCTKYMIRNGNIRLAERTIALFTRAETPNPIQDLIEMQCMWFTLECGLAHMKRGRLGRALKCFHQISKHFADITDDQFDFHTYCLRRMTIRAYIRMLRLEDTLRSHPFYYEASLKAIECYLLLHDRPALVEEALSLAEKDSQEEEDVRKVVVGKPRKGLDSTKASKDHDPLGTSLLQSANFLGEALKLYQPLHNLADRRIATHILGFELFIRQKRLLLALRALKHAHAIDPDNPHLHPQKIRLALAFREYQQSDEKNVLVEQVIQDELDGWLPVSQDELRKLNAAFKVAREGSIFHLVGACEGMIALDPGSKEEATECINSNIRQQDFRRLGLGAASVLAAWLEKAFCLNIRGTMSSAFPDATGFKDGGAERP